MNRHIIFHFIFACIFCGYLIVGFHIFRDYGVPIDEFSQIDLGRVNYERITKGSLEIQKHFDRYYGPMFEVSLYAFSHGIASLALGMEEMSSRRLIMFIFFAVSLIFYYRCISMIFNHPAYGLIAVILLLCSPRIFAESFYNTKDIAFLSSVIFVLWAFVRIQLFTWKNLVLLSAFTGFAMSMRAQGLLVLAAIMTTFLVYGKEDISKRIIFAFLYGIFALLVTYLMFPVFWNDPMKNIIGFWQSSVNSIGVPTYYFGKILVSPNIPWHYHFIWVAISSLLSVVLTCLFGIVWFVLFHVRNSLAVHAQHRALIAMACIVLGTFAMSVFFHPRSYDGWRHIYYIYPCMIGFSMYTIKVFFEYRKTRIFVFLFALVVVSIFADVIHATMFMMKNHPNQYVYFNALAGGYARAKANFDFDYWGISYKQLYEYLRTMPIKKTTYIYYEQVLPYTKFVMIPRLYEKGMHVVQTAQEADIYVSIQRDYKMPPPPGFHKLYAVTVDGVEVSTIYVADVYRKTL